MGTPMRREPHGQQKRQVVLAKPQPSNRWTSDGAPPADQHAHDRLYGHGQARRRWDIAAVLGREARRRRASLSVADARCEHLWKHRGDMK
jgi:hypothetical protein